MPDEKTNGDSIRAYLTGAVTDGGAQDDHDLSLGHFRSSTEARPLAIEIINPLASVTIEHVSGANGTGNGSLSSDGANALRWTPPGGTQGALVTILNGETKILEGGTASKFIRVTRTTANDLDGSATVALSTFYNNAVGQDNLSSAEALAGHVSYRALMFKNESSGTVTNIQAWVDPAVSGISIGLELPISSHIQDRTAGGDTQAPAGVTFDSGTTPGTGLQIGTVPAGGMVGIWIKRDISAAAVASALTLSKIHYSFDTA